MTGGDAGFRIGDLIESPEEYARRTHGWGVCIGGFIKAYHDWQIRGHASGFGYTARQRNAARRPRGPALTARSLDELAAVTEAELLRRAHLPETARGGTDA